jgi:hypothetical protein
MARNPQTDDVETNVENPGIDPAPEPGTPVPDEGARRKKESIESPGVSDEDQDELEREDEAVDEEDPL